MTRTDIINTVATVWETQPKSLRLNTRKSEVLKPRQMAIYLIKLYKLYGSLTEVANEFGLKSHATVIHTAKSHNSFMLSNRDYRNRYNLVMEVLLQDSMYSTEVYPKEL